MGEIDIKGAFVDSKSVKKILERPCRLKAFGERLEVLGSCAPHPKAVEEAKNIMRERARAFLDSIGAMEYENSVKVWAVNNDCIADDPVVVFWKVHLPEQIAERYEQNMKGESECR